MMRQPKKMIPQNCGASRVAKPETEYGQKPVMEHGWNSETEQGQNLVSEHGQNPETEHGQNRSID
jgi:hypothetical protein